MNGWFVLRDTKKNMYYNNDCEFMEPNKKYAKKLRHGQAKAIIINKSRFVSDGSGRFVVEPI